MDFIFVQISELHSQLEQERSKVSVLKLELAKFQVIIQDISCLFVATCITKPITYVFRKDHMLSKTGNVS